MKTILSSRFIVPSLIILAFLIMGITLLAPIDRVLGAATRLVYVHGAIIRVVLGTFLLSGVLGLIYLFNPRPRWAEWSQILQEASLLLWLPYLFSSVVATLQTWGAIAWFEPRWVVTLQISVVAPLAYGVSWLVKKPIVTAGLNVVVAVAILILTRNAGLVLHPIDPIGSSGNTGIIGSYLILLALCALFALQVVRGLRFWRQRRRVQAMPA